jgi:hypothetical protein
MGAINNPAVAAALLLLTPYVIFFLEAYLEVVVIALKDGKLKDYETLNRKEHNRSFFLAASILAPFISVAIYCGFYALIPAILVSRRLIFDPVLKVFRKRRLVKYEGGGPVDAFCARLFGAEGAAWEIACEATLTVLLYFFSIR